jgi:hypothetical protein
LLSGRFFEALTPGPSPNSGRGESDERERFFTKILKTQKLLLPFSQNWEKGLGVEG